ncbi:MAG: alpha/beta fold hydrolase [Rhodoferax sp.]|nr:alpha/beta fold hydrolase [Rhodoferax sp.]MBP9059364.1 alpha/beta fold hydrolase [Rhodoferax sp.]
MVQIKKPLKENRRQGRRSESPSLRQKAYWSLINSLEKRFFKENFVISNQTPFQEIFNESIMSVRHYPALKVKTIQVGDQDMKVMRKKHRIPLVLVPPLAATSIIFDLLPQRSVVKFFLARGFDVYLIDWGTVTARDHDLSLETYVAQWMPAALERIREHSGQQEISIFAYCMGGLLSLMYAAVSQDPNIRNIVTVASPVDMHQSGIAGRVLTLIRRPARLISAMFHVSVHDLPARFAHVPGWVSSLAFKLTNPIGNLAQRFELLMNLWDREYMKENHTMGTWFNNMVDYPGETIKDMAVHMMINNRMSKGVMRFGNQEASFHNIDCSILAFAGDNDTIVSVQAARKVLDIVSSEDKEFCIVPGGHAGVFAGSKAAANTWTLSADWLAQRSS